MEPKDFINKDLNDLDKVRLTLHGGTVLEGYFGGYKCFEGTHGFLEYGVFPVFYRAGKKGQYVKRSLFEGRSPYIAFRDIKDVERITVQYRHIGYYNNPDDCFYLGIRGPKVVLDAFKKGEGAFVGVDNDEPFNDVVPDRDTTLLEDGRYAVRYNYNRKCSTLQQMQESGEDCGYYIDIFERIDDAA